jgi:hypothetical protein
MSYPKSQNAHVAMPAMRKLSFRPDVPMCVVYLVNGKMAIFVEYRANA